MKESCDPNTTWFWQVRVGNVGIHKYPELCVNIYVVWWNDP